MATLQTSQGVKKVEELRAVLGGVVDFDGFLIE
jgi:hypothetical protein